MVAINSRDSAMTFFAKWGIRRDSPKFWSTSDFYNTVLRKGNSANPWIQTAYMGILDINRYLLDTQTGNDLEVPETIEIEEVGSF